MTSSPPSKRSRLIFSRAVSHTVVTVTKQPEPRTASPVAEASVPSAAHFLDGLWFFSRQLSLWLSSGSLTCMLSSDWSV